MTPLTLICLLKNFECHTKLAFPQSNIEDAQNAVKSVKYPPNGIRGIAGATRANNFGRETDYVSLADDNICVICQIESVEACKNVKDIASVKGVDLLFVGPGDLSINDVNLILDESQKFIKLNQSKNKRLNVLNGKTQINLFFEPSTRTQSSFELAGKRLGADVMSMNMGNSAIKKGETLIDTAMTLNAMHPDIIVIRHQDSGACNLLSQKVNCAVLNAGDGRREHPTQALLDALTIINRKNKIQG